MWNLILHVGTYLKVRNALHTGAQPRPDPQNVLCIEMPTLHLRIKHVVVVKSLQEKKILWVIDLLRLD